MKYKVTQKGEDLFYPNGALLSECLDSIAEYTAHYMGESPIHLKKQDVTASMAVAWGFQVVSIH